MITEAGLDEKVAALVYITAFAPDKGESVRTILAEADLLMAVNGYPTLADLGRDAIRRT